MKNNIQIAITEALRFLEDIPLSARSVTYYRHLFGTINRFCKRKGFISFSDSEAEVFTNFQMDRLQKGEITQGYFTMLRKAAAILSDCFCGRELKWEYKKNNKASISGSYERTLQEFEAFLSQSLEASTVRGLVLKARQFLFFLEEKGLHDLKNLKLEDVRQYFISAAPRNKSSMPGLMRSVKKFVSWLSASGYSTISAEHLTIISAPKRSKAFPCFTARETNALLSAVDTSTPLGKRDFAILKIAIGTGLRESDIRNLQLADIDWRKNEISLVQQKTGRHITLPLLAYFGNALAEYILTARPKSDSPYIFLRHLSPHVKLGYGLGAEILKRYLGKAGISRKPDDGKTFHGFRRKKGKRLLKAEIPVATIAQILGHHNIESTKAYLPLNDDMLRVCCMDMSAFATQKEGLI